VYVLRWFASDEEAAEIRAEIKAEALKAAQHKKKLKTSMKKFDSESKEDEPVA